tara:strand:- start:331 stop:885 length:555 start_codon:yes stop_codon:yes gene_type:complete
MVSAGLSDWLVWEYGFVAVFWLAAAFGAVSIVSVLMIPKNQIDDKAARGMPAGIFSPKTTSASFETGCVAKAASLRRAVSILFHVGFDLECGAIGTIAMGTAQSRSALVERIERMTPELLLVVCVDRIVASKNPRSPQCRRPEWRSPFVDGRCAEPLAARRDGYIFLQVGEASIPRFAHRIAAR